MNSKHKDTIYLYQTQEYGYFLTEHKEYKSEHIYKPNNIGDIFYFEIDTKTKIHSLFLQNTSDYSIDEVLVNNLSGSGTSKTIAYTKKFEDQKISESIAFHMKPKRKLYSIFGSKNKKIEKFILYINESDNNEHISCRIKLSGYEDATDLQWDITEITMEVYIVVNSSAFKKIRHITSYGNIESIELSLYCVDGFYVSDNEIDVKILDPKIVNILYNGQLYDTYNCIFTSFETIDDFENHHICSNEDKKRKLHLPHSLLVKNYSLFVENYELTAPK